jgi:hypothetical protein
MSDHTLADSVKERFDPFMTDMLSMEKDNVHSIYITGSALTADYNPGRSDINSVLMLNRMDLKLVECYAPLGKKYGKKGVAAPLIMTPAYIGSSADVFPMEFFNIKLLHACVYGTDFFVDLNFADSDLRHQCERELKSRLVGLRQGFIAAAGDRKLLANEFVRSFSGYIPLFRAVIRLLGDDPPLTGGDVLKALEKVSGVAMDGFRTVMNEKRKPGKLSSDQLIGIFEQYYTAVEKLGDIIDALETR